MGRLVSRTPVESRRPGGRHSSPAVIAAAAEAAAATYAAAALETAARAGGPLCQHRPKIISSITKSSCVCMRVWAATYPRAGPKQSSAAPAAYDPAAVSRALASPRRRRRPPRPAPPPPRRRPTARARGCPRRLRRLRQRRGRGRRRGPIGRPRRRPARWLVRCMCSSARVCAGGLLRVGAGFGGYRCGCGCRHGCDTCGCMCVRAVCVRARRGVHAFVRIRRYAQSVCYLLCECGGG